MIESCTIVRVIEGLHTRPAAHMARLAKGFEASVELVCRGMPANAKSSVKLMLLGVKEGDEIILRADGCDESEALQQLVRFLQEPRSGLDEDTAVAPHTAAQAAPSAAAAPCAESSRAVNCVEGIAGSRGTAMGPAHVYLPQPMVALTHVIDAADIPAELCRFRDALARFVRQSLNADNGAASAQDRAILQALVDVAQDEEYVGAIIRGIEAQGDATAVTLRVGEVLAATFEAMSDGYMRARAEDIRGVTRQLAASLLGVPLPDLSTICEPCILVAADLSAWEFAQLPVKLVMGLVCSGGSATSHVAIMARTHGIPAVLGVPINFTDWTTGQVVVVDGDHGLVTFDPDTHQREHAQARLVAEAAACTALSRYRDVQPRTRDGRLIEVVANLGALSEIALAHGVGAMGVGLFRTELLFMQQRTLPTEDEQASVYRELAQAFHPLPVIVRTLDIGGDKPVAGIDFPREENPFLGWRGVRMCLDRPDVFKPQLRALLRAATVGNLRVMIPMVSEIEEVRRVRSMIAECEAELRFEGQAFAGFELGIMIETPAAVLQADELAAEVSFFSIGTNDLTQYIMAVDRANAQIAALYRTEHPAVMRAVQLTCEAAQRAGIWVGVCGEAAANLDLIPRFIELGVTELSMSPSSILAAKKRISEL